MSHYLHKHIDEAFSTLKGAYAPNTLKSYYTDTNAFVDWCGEKNIEPFPLTSAGTRVYIETMAPDYSYASIRRRLSCLRRVNKLLGHEEHTHTEKKSTLQFAALSVRNVLNNNKP